LQRASRKVKSIIAWLNSSKRPGKETFLMQRHTIGYLVRSPVFLLALLLAVLVPFAAIGIYTMLNPRGEPQPDPDPVVSEPAPAPSPVLIEVAAQFPGAAPEEVERQVTIPLEVGLAGMPRLKDIRSKSLFGLSCLSLQFEDRTDRDQARREVIDRLSFLQALPAGVIPMLSPIALDNEVLRYVLHSPRDAQGRDIYTLSDLKACQDWILEREFRRVPGVIDVTSVGGTAKRYEVHLDLDRLRAYGMTIQQVQDALAASNANIGGDFLPPVNVRAVGLFGGGIDPLQQVLGMKDPRAAAERLRAEEIKRVREIRQVVVATVNTVAVRLEDVIEGGRLAPGDEQGRKGVVVAHQPRFGRVGLAVAGRPDEADIVEGIVLRRPGEERNQVLKSVNAKIKELNETPERMPPGVHIEIVHEWKHTGGLLSPNTPLWVHGTFPATDSQDSVAGKVRTIRGILDRYPEVQLVLSQFGGGDGSDMIGTNQVECLVVFKPGDWPVAAGRDRPRTQAEVAEEIRTELKRTIVGADCVVSPHRRDPFLSAFVAAPDEEMVKIVGPDLAELDRLARQVRTTLAGIPGIEDVAVREIMARSEMVFRVDPDKCAKWGVRAADVTNLVQIAIGTRAVTSMIEGEKQFDIKLRVPGGKSVLDLPVDTFNNQVEPAIGQDIKPPPANNPIRAANPRLRLRDLVSPLGPDGAPDPKGDFERVGASVIYREQGRRCIAVTFRIAADDKTAILDEARQKAAALIEVPYSVEWDRH
jgi:Cu/Ag efflux pump CusA